MTETTHMIDYTGAQNGVAFRVENAILTLTYLRTYDPAFGGSYSREG